MVMGCLYPNGVVGALPIRRCEERSDVAVQKRGARAAKTFWIASLRSQRRLELFWIASPRSQGRSPISRLPPPSYPSLRGAKRRGSPEMWGQSRENFWIASLRSQRRLGLFWIASLRSQRRPAKTSPLTLPLKSQSSSLHNLKRRRSHLLTITQMWSLILWNNPS